MWKVKLFLYRPNRPLGLQEVQAPRISRQSEHVDHHYPHDTSLVHTSVNRLSRPWAIVGPERLSQWKIPMTPSEIEPITFQLVPHCLNQLLHRAPQKVWVWCNKSHSITAAIWSWTLTALSYSWSLTWVVVVSISTNKCTVLYIMYFTINLLLFYMFRRNRHLQGANTNVVKTYSKNSFTIIIYIKCAGFS